MTDPFQRQHLDTRVVPVRADLVVTPTQSMAGPVDRLTWEITVGPGPGAAGPAGVATLAPGCSGLRAHFDYAAPERFLSLRVPCGSSTGRSTDNRDITAADAALVSRLLSPKVLTRLQEDGATQVSEFLASNPAWSMAGRLAVLQSSVAWSARPLDGLWAAEALALLRQLGLAHHLGEWTSVLLDDAMPALRVLPPSVVTQLEQYPNEVNLLYNVLLACDDLQAVGMGPVLEELRATFGGDSLASAEFVLASVEARSLVKETEDSMRAGLAFRGVIEGDVPPVRSEALVDFTAVGTVDCGKWIVDDSRLKLDIEPTSAARRLPAALRERLMVLVTSRSEGTLVAATLVVPEDPEGHLRTAIELPPGIDPDHLLVCIGRHIPVEAMTEDDFAERQARESERRLVEETRPLFLAELIGPLLQRAELAALADTGEERAQGGARSLAWSAAGPSWNAHSDWGVDAARYELGRLQRSNHHELTLEQSDALVTMAALFDDELAQALDHLSADAYADLFG